jgi:hypothetical protein
MPAVVYCNPATVHARVCIEGTQIGSKFQDRESGFSLHDPELSARLAYVSYWGHSGKHMLGVRFSQYDPNVWSGRALQEVSPIWLMCGLASMYPASDWSVLCSRPPWISARLRSH